MVHSFTLKHDVTVTTQWDRRFFTYAEHAYVRAYSLFCNIYSYNTLQFYRRTWLFQTQEEVFSCLFDLRHVAPAYNVKAMHPFTIVTNGLFFEGKLSPWVASGQGFHSTLNHLVNTSPARAAQCSCNCIQNKVTFNTMADSDIGFR